MRHIPVYADFLSWGIIPLTCRHLTLERAMAAAVEPLLADD